MKLALLFAAIASGLLAQKASPMLIDVESLSGVLNDRDLVLLHVGPKPEYDAGHIPGARQIYLNDVALPMKHDNPMEIMLELPPPEELRAKLASYGISSDSRIVLYTGPKGVFQSTTRVVFTLDYLGLGDRASVLNGGMEAWKAAGKKLTTDVP